MLSKSPVEIVSVIRPMRGASQAYLVQGSDNFYYVAKFTNNPEGNRTLINECIASHLLSALGITTPEVALLQLTDSCAGRNQLHFSTDRHEAIENGLHLGSKCPVDPESVAIFDFLPSRLYSHISNLAEVGIVFAFDFWVCNIDHRQFIFARKRHALASKHGRRTGLTAWAIDNGRCFGRNWKPRAAYPLVRRPTLPIYRHCPLAESALTGAKLIRDLPAAVIESSHRQIPRSWFGERDEEALAVMLCALQERQQHSSTAIEEQFRRRLGDAVPDQAAVSWQSDPVA